MSEITGYILLFGISGGEILIILLIVLLLFGPSKIPEIARLIGRGMNEVKKVQREINTEIQRYSADVEKETKKIQRDINEIKKDISKVVESEDQQDYLQAGKTAPASSTVPAGDTKPYSPYDFEYDEYGLKDEYSRATSAATENVGSSHNQKKTTDESIKEKVEENKGADHHDTTDQADQLKKTPRSKKSVGKPPADSPKSRLKVSKKGTPTDNQGNKIEKDTKDKGIGDSDKTPDGNNL